VAEDPAAARQRVLAARAEFTEQLTVLEASGRAAADIPARIKRSPGKVAAVVGGVGFLALKGPQRVVRVTKRAVGIKPEPFPKSMLPAEVEKTVRKLGSDGDKVRGALERDFAAYAKASHKQRDSIRTLLLLSLARPVLARVGRTAAETLFTPDAPGFQVRLDQVRARMDEAMARRAAEDPGAPVAPPRPGAASHAAPDSPPASPSVGSSPVERPAPEKG
jgi:hypothetical protein